MKEIYFDKIVKKILKSRGKILSSEKVKSIVEDIMADKYTDKKAYKMVYYLKNKGYLISLKKDIYYATSPEVDFNIEELIERFYWQILKQNAKGYLMNDWYIGGLKALELNISNFDIPEDIDIVNPYKQSKEVVLAGKYINFKKFNLKGENLYRKLKKQTNKITIGRNSFMIANIELAILETLYSPDILSGNYAQELIKKILRKNKKNINYDAIIQIIRLGKHHSSLNRLYKISKHVDPKITDELAKIIKRYSFFLEL